MPKIVRIKHRNEVVAIIVPADYKPERLEFITPDNYKQQVGFIVYPGESEIVRHIHLELNRHLIGTSEVLLVRKGHCLADFYAQDKTFLCTHELRQGDTLILVSGGHGFRMIEDTVFLEIKQGPYLNEKEKERF